MQMSISAGLYSGERRIVLESRDMPEDLKTGDTFLLDELGKDVTVHEVVNGTVFTRLGLTDYAVVRDVAQKKAAA